MNHDTTNSEELRAISEIKEVAPYTLMSKYYKDILFYVDYESWFSFLSKIIKKHKIGLEKVLDISCGNGGYVAYLLERGIDAYGSDLSKEFIKEAKGSVTSKDKSRFCVADMLSYDKSSNFSLVVSLHDSINYLTTKTLLKRFFANAEKLLKDGGFLVFDITSEYNVLEYFDDSTMSDTFEDNTTFFWNSVYSKKRRIVTSTIDFLMPANKKQSLWKVVREKHSQKVWTDEEIKKATSLSFKASYGDFSTKTPNSKTQSITYVFQKER